jgi:uncharacterized membrane protein
MRKCLVLLLSSIIPLAFSSSAALAGMASAAPGTAAATLPAPPAWLDELETLYDARLRLPGLEDRRFQPEQWWAAVDPLLADAPGLHAEEVGRSAEGRPLRHLAWGEGPTQVLLWSQMHGDESTASMALADLLHLLSRHPEHPLVRRLHATTRLHLLPIVNPDGAARFQRRNAQGIDINRDARALASPEARVLHGLRERIRPDYGFNLHDQQVGYRAGPSERGTAIALLAPPSNEARDVDPARARAIQLAVAVRAALEPRIGGHIAKWDDTYNPRAFGDLTAAAGVSTLLVESGGIEGDLQKQQLRKLNFLALAAALDAIATGSHLHLSHAPYDELPTNGEVWPDLLIAGGTLVLPGRTPARADVQVGFSEPLLQRGGSIEDIGDLGHVRARRVIDASGLYVHPLGEDARLAPRAPARLRLTRDPEGEDVVWTLAGDSDPTTPAPAAAPRG